jgi:hypothetical protein
MFNSVISSYIRYNNICSGRVVVRTSDSCPEDLSSNPAHDYFFFKQNFRPANNNDSGFATIRATKHIIYASVF